MVISAGKKSPPCLDGSHVTRRMVGFSDSASCLTTSFSNPTFENGGDEFFCINIISDVAFCSHVCVRSYLTHEGFRSAHFESASAENNSVLFGAVVQEFNKMSKEGIS